MHGLHHRTRTDMRQKAAATALLLWYWSSLLLSVALLWGGWQDATTYRYNTV